MNHLTDASLCCAQEQRDIDLFYAMEDSSCCLRTFCPGHHPFTMNVSQGSEPGGILVSSHVRPCALAVHPCKCCLYQRIDSFDGATGTFVGTFKVVTCAPNVVHIFLVILLLFLSLFLFLFFVFTSTRVTLTQSILHPLSSLPQTAGDVLALLPHLRVPHPRRPSAVRGALSHVFRGPLCQLLCRARGGGEVLLLPSALLYLPPRHRWRERA